MKKTLLSFIAFFAVALLATAQTNLLQNGDFETWTNGQPDNWKTASTAGNATLTQSTDAHGGSSSVSVSFKAGSNLRLGYKELKLKAGDYTFKFWAKGGQTQGGHVPMGADGKPGTYAYGGYVTTGNAWTEVTYSFNLKAEATVCLVVMNPKNNENKGYTAQTLLVDDASLTTENGGIADEGTTTPPDPVDPDPVDPDPTVPDYTSISELKADATKTSVNVTFTFNDLLVTGVGQSGKNYSVYVTDGTEGMLFYGPNTPSVKKGDKINGQLAGGLKLYSNLTEIENADYSKVTVSSSDNAVAPVATTLAAIKASQDKAFENLYVRLEGVSFKSEALASRNITMTDEEGNELVLRDNFNVLTDYIFKTGEKYNVNAYVAYYNANAQLYPMSADEVELITNLTDPATAWANAAVAQEPGKTFVPNVLSTLTDGAKTFTSSDEQVATVDAEGNVTFTGFGKTTITVHTAATETYMESQASYTLYNIKGEGTLENPYIATDLGFYNGTVTEPVWMKGIIMGCYANGGVLATEKVATNLAVGEEGFFVPVALPYVKEGFDIRAELNVVDHADYIGKEIYLCGKIDTYFNTTGLKETSAYSWNGADVTAIGRIEADTNTAGAIYDLSGRRVVKAERGLYIIGGKKVLVK